MIGKDAQIGREGLTAVSSVGRRADTRDVDLFPRWLREGGSLPLDGDRLASGYAFPHLQKYRALSSLASRWAMHLTVSTQWTRRAADHAHQHMGIS
jgi:hypothetical protein